MLLLHSPALERENDENSVGAWLLLPNPTVPSGWQSSLCPRHPTACCQCSCWDRVAHRVLGGAPPLTSRRSVAVGLAAGWAHLLATAESWSRMRPSPSNIVSRVSLLSSTVTAETEGLSPHRLGSSWIWKENMAPKSKFPLFLEPWTHEPYPILGNFWREALCSEL